MLLIEREINVGSKGKQIMNSERQFTASPQDLVRQKVLNDPIARWPDRPICDGPTDRCAMARPTDVRWPDRPMCDGPMIKSIYLESTAFSTTPSIGALTLTSSSRARVNASLGVSPLRTTSNTPSVWTERMTASVAAMIGGESITTNLYFFRNSAMASTSLV